MNSLRFMAVESFFRIKPFFLCVGCWALFALSYIDVQHALFYLSTLKLRLRERRTL